MTNSANRAQVLSQFILPPQLPAHIAIVMDGNGRWALQRHLPRIAGHRAGLQTVRNIVSACAHWKIPALTLFAFSSENWGRPPQEVQFLMNLFHSTLLDEVDALHNNQIRLRIMGDRDALSTELQAAIHYAEQKTAQNTGLNLSIAINYSGRWEMTQAMQQIAEKIKTGELTAGQITQTLIDQHSCFAQLPELDLFIRTSGELRISNFMLWQLAYAELYFCEEFWPDFDDQAFYAALCAYAKRERRYGVLEPASKVLEHA